MAVALNPTKTLYSKKGENSERSERNNTITSSASNNFMSASSYADSPSRQLRRSARVASLSPSSFTPLISEQSSSGSTSGTSSYMPTSPSSKYSIMRGGYNGVSIDEIVINEIEPENNRGIKNREKSTKPPLSSSSSSSSSSFYPTLESFTNLRSNPDRKHPTLDFQPTNLSTPSTTLSQNNKSGITPAIKQINLHQQQETTPGQVFLENLVTKGDMEEIAKATPLGSYYNRKSSEAVVGVGADKSKIQIISEKSRASGSYSSNSFNSTINPQNNSFSTSLNSNSQSSNNSNNSNSSYQAHNYTNRNAVEMVKTPQKQTNDPVIDSDETVKVVRTLRNRSIVASPLPATSSKSLAPSTSRENKPKIDVTVLFKKHQKNLLAYSLVSLFLFATIYHIYDGLFSIGIEDINSSSSSSSSSAVGSSSGAVVSGDNLVRVNQSEKEEILKLIETKFTEIQEVENEKVLNLFEKVEKIEKENPAVTAEQKKELERVSKLVEKLEEKFEELEIKLEKEREKEREREREEKLQTKEKEKLQSNSNPKSESNSNPKSESNSNPHSNSNSNSKILTSHPHHFAHLKIVKHLSTSPIGSGLFKSSQFPPENAISPQPIPFKFSGNRGKLALFVILPHNPHTPHNPPSHLILEHPLLPDRSCAPKDFEIWALRNVLNECDKPVLIFKGTFDLSKESQSFSLNQERLNKLIKDRTVLLQLRIRNNHGNSKFTCLYNLKFQI